jgi:hypothetical protein
MRTALLLLSAAAPAFARPAIGRGLSLPISSIPIIGGGSSCTYSCPFTDLTGGILTGVTSVAGLLECTFLDLTLSKLLCLYSEVSLPALA